MRPSVLQTLSLSLLLVGSALLSGCSGSDTEEGDGTSTSTTTRGVRTTGTGTTGGGGGGTGDNNKPTGSISASVLAGSVPVNVTFDLKGTDEDGDELTWNLDVSGDGKTDKSGNVLPATVYHNYTEEGVVEVTYTLSDGIDSETYKVTLNLSSGAVGPTQTITGSWSYGNPPVCAAFYPNPNHAANEAQQELTMLIADVNPDTIGKTFKATFGAAGTGQVSVHVHFSSDDTIILESFSGAGPELTGEVPEDATKVTFQTCGPMGNSVTYEA